MAVVIGISGSLRSGSFNTSLLRTAVTLAPAGLTIEVASIREIPLYDADVETAIGAPPPVTALKDRIAAADGLLLVTPEYNNSVPGVLKNAVDWLSRPARDIARVFGGKPVSLMGATNGNGGTILAQAAWLPVMRTLGALVWAGPRVYVSNSPRVFDAEGGLTDEAIRQRIATHLRGFADFIARIGPRPA